MKLVFYTDDEDIVSLVEDNSSFEDVQFIENINEVEGLLDEDISFLVILDFDSNKKQCEKLLKNIHEFENAHSVVVSSEMKIKHFKKHQKSKYGADGYLRKPLNQIDLIQVYDDFSFNIEPSNSEDDSENLTDVEFSTSSSDEEVAKESSAELDETFDIHEDKPSELDKNNEFSSSEIEFDLDSSTEQDIGETMGNDEINDKDSSLNTDSQLDLETDSNLDIDTSIEIESSFDEESLNIDDEVNVNTDTSIDKKIDLDLGEEVDAGIDLDLGGEEDAVIDLDIGGEVDAGIDLDLGGEEDAGIDLDIGGEVDAGIDLDLGREADAGIDLDLGGEADAGIDLDLGGEADAGIDLDLGGEADAGIDLDLGGEADAGIDLDLGG
ncbi:MAG: hypothetical protein HOJ35_07265, partial [Bdellovibrionales bacterium]|nr:hypothetical protein [Bdellovibrionales bacterium]